MATDLHAFDVFRIPCLCRCVGGEHLTTLSFSRKVSESVAKFTVFSILRHLKRLFIQSFTPAQEQNP